MSHEICDNLSAIHHEQKVVEGETNRLDFLKWSICHVSAMERVQTTALNVSNYAWESLY